jgi:hypothetical protein
MPASSAGSSSSFTPIAPISDHGALMERFLGPDNYALVVIPPGIWTEFKGMSDVSIVANYAHDPTNTERSTRSATRFRTTGPFYPARVPLRLGTRGPASAKVRPPRPRPNVRSSALGVGFQR